MTGIQPTVGVAHVNLMPRSEIARRERDKLIRLWAWIVLGAVVVVLLVIAVSLVTKLFADQRLAAEQARTSTLQSEIGGLGEVSDALDTQAELTDYRSEAMSTDLEWAPALGEITDALPAGTSLTGFDLGVGDAPTGEGDPAEQPGLTGVVSLESPSPLELPEIVRTLRGVDGILFVDGQSVTGDRSRGDSYAYEVTLQFDQTVYTGAYANEEDGQR